LGFPTDACCTRIMPPLMDHYLAPTFIVDADILLIQYPFRCPLPFLRPSKSMNILHSSSFFVSWLSLLHLAVAASLVILKEDAALQTENKCLMHVKHMHELSNLLTHIPTYLPHIWCYIHTLYLFLRIYEWFLYLNYNSARQENFILCIFNFQDLDEIKLS
jgi:hypothetical protein